MAAPNIINSSTFYGKTAFYTPSNTSSNVILANPAGSNKVYKVNLIQASNSDSTNPIDATVSINTSASGAGSSYPLASTIPVPAKSSLIVTDKSSMFYLEEDRSILVTSATANKLTFVVSYEEIG